MSVKSIPDGYHTITPYLLVDGVAKLMSFLSKAFDASELERRPRPDDSIMHAEVRIGASIIMLGEPLGEFGPMPASLYLYVSDCDSVYQRALQADGISVMEPTTRSGEGDRYGGVKDPSGNIWWIATHVQDASSGQTKLHEERLMSMNKRNTMLSLIQDAASPDYIPAAFFLHFDPAYHQGQAAIDKHLEFFRTTGMDFVKIQYEQPFPPSTPIPKPEDWAHAPLCSDEFFEATIHAVESLVQATQSKALVIMTLYSPFMWARHLDEDADITNHLKENPEAVKKGLEIMTENVLTLVRGCRRAGVDGFYASSQGGEAFRFQDPSIFQKYIKPTDLAIWDEISSCSFNILHVCDYEGGYDDLTPFLDYPGHVVNSSLKLGDRTLTPGDLSQLFGRPFMGGMDRKGVLAAGNPEAIRQAVTDVLAETPERFILAADCTVPSDTPWENLRTAIETAHQYQKH